MLRDTCVTMEKESVTATAPFNFLVLTFHGSMFLLFRKSKTRVSFPLRWMCFTHICQHPKSLIRSPWAPGLIYSFSTKMKVANHEKGMWIYKTRNKNMICAQIRLRFQFAESRQNTTRNSWAFKPK